MPQEWGHAEMTRWIDGETWRRRDEEAGEREMGDGGGWGNGWMGDCIASIGWGVGKWGDGGGWGMRAARPFWLSAEGVVHARAFLDLCTRAQFFWVFKLFSVGGAGPCAILRFLFFAHLFAR